MVDIQSIHLRPPVATDCLMPGRWEGDFLVGARNHSAIGVLVDRKTLFTVLARMDGCTAADALKGFSRVLRRLPLSVRQILIYHQGKETALHRVLTRKTQTQIYFASVQHATASHFELLTTRCRVPAWVRHVGACG